MSFGMPAAFAGEYEDARALVVAQRWSEALPLLKKLNEEEPDSVTIAQDLAQTLLRLNRREEALELLREHRLAKQAQIAAKAFLSKESFRFYQQGLDWLSKRSYAQACERFEKALEKDQGHAEILLRIAQCEILDGNADLGLKWLDQLERVHGKSPETSAWRGRALHLKGRHDEAIATLAEAGAETKSSDPLSEWIAIWLGEAFVAGGKKVQAGAAYEADLRRSPSHLVVALAALRLRAASAESPNQFLQISRELEALEKKIVAARDAKKKTGREFTLEPFDAEALQRGATELRESIRPQLVTPTPSASPAAQGKEASKG
jgi:tetratricopeptide (TPR) repeat protein